MSWTDVFPVFTDTDFEDYQNQATALEKQEAENYFRIEKRTNEQASSHVVSMSLFWKPTNLEDKPYPVPSRSVLMNSDSLNDIEMRFAPWEHYVAPLLKQVPILKEKFPEVAFRVYLAADLEFLTEDLVQAGCEVFLMSHSSLAFAPGGLWRFLAIESKEVLVTICDIDRLDVISGDIERTESAAASGFGAWKVPIWKDLDQYNEVCYRPFSGCQSGWAIECNISKLLEAFTWASKKGLVGDLDKLFEHEAKLSSKSTWPNYGFDEWFLAVALYPFVSQYSILNFVPGGASGKLLLLDVEYITWASNKSETVFF